MGGMCGCLQGGDKDKVGTDITLHKSGYTEDKFQREKAAEKIQKEYRRGFKPSRQTRAGRNDKDALFDEYCSRLVLTNPTTRVMLYIWYIVYIYGVYMVYIYGIC